MEVLRVTYWLRADADTARARAQTVALEQTVEVPAEVVRHTEFAAETVGRVECVEPDPKGGQRATIAYPVDTTARDPAQLLNVIFGNTSLHADARCVDIDLPPSLLAAFRGPRFGVEGLRKTVGVHGRPLTCTAVKPMGLSVRALASRCRSFARAGIDVIKDDHGLADHPFAPFEERVRACLEATREVADETGHLATYVPNLTGSPSQLFRRLCFAEAAGARAVMVSPMLIGLPVLWELCQERASVPVIAHPAFAGSGWISHEVLFGALFRLFGADAVIFVNFGSRFSAGVEACRALGRRLSQPWGGLRPALPVPAGGLALENAAEVARFYGADSMLLIGGDLQVEPGSLEARSRAFVASVRGGGG